MINFPVVHSHSNMSLRDSLSSSMEPFRYKMEKFRERHQSLRYRSIRLMRKSMFLDQEAYEVAINKALAQVTSNSEAAAKVHGINVLFEIRTKQIAHATKFRNKASPGGSPGVHSFEPIVTEAQIHSMSSLKRKLRFQRDQIQFLSADFEAIVLIFFLEDNMIKEGVMNDEKRLKTTSKLLKLSPKGEYNLNEVRSLLCG